MSAPDRTLAEAIRDRMEELGLPEVGRQRIAARQMGVEPGSLSTWLKRWPVRLPVADHYDSVRTWLGIDWPDFGLLLIASYSLQRRTPDLRSAEAVFKGDLLVAETEAWLRKSA